MSALKRECGIANLLNLMLIFSNCQFFVPGEFSEHPHRILTDKLLTFIMLIASGVISLIDRILLFVLKVSITFTLKKTQLL